MNHAKTKEIGLLGLESVKACEWLLIKTIAINKNNQGITFVEIKETLRHVFRRIYQTNPHFLFNLGVGISLKRELVNLSALKLIERRCCSEARYRVTIFGIELLPKKEEIVKYYTKVENLDSLFP